MPKQFITIASVLLALLLCGSQSFFIVPEGSYAIVKQLNDANLNIEAPLGLNYKIPFIQNVVLFDNRIFETGNDPVTVRSKDNKSFIVTSQASWRVQKAELFMKNFGTIEKAKVYVNTTINEAWMETLAPYDLAQIISGNLSALAAIAEEKARPSLSTNGLELKSFSLKNIAYSQAHQETILNSMQLEQKAILDKYNAEGQKSADQIKSEALEAKTIILERAYQESELIRSKAFADTTAILLNATKEYTSLYELIKIFNIYNKVLSKKSNELDGSDYALLKIFEEKLTKSFLRN